MVFCFQALYSSIAYSLQWYIHSGLIWLNFIPLLPLFPIKTPQTNQTPPSLVFKCFCLSWRYRVGVFSKHMDRLVGWLVSILWNLDSYLFSTCFGVQIGSSVALSQAWWWDSSTTTVCTGAKASMFGGCGSVCLPALHSHADMRRVAAFFQFPYIFVSWMFLTQKHLFLVIAKSQPFGFQPRLSRYPFTSLSEELGYSLYCGRELTSQAPVWNCVLRCAGSVKGLEIC